MAETIEIKASARPRSGKGAARSARREGKVPGVIYGPNTVPETISIDHAALWQTVLKGRFLSTVFNLNVDGKTIRVVPRELQLDPVKDFPIHVDFQRVTADSRIRVKVAAKFINETASPGIKRGGVLNIVRREIEVFCPPDHIPDVFEFDLTGLEIGRAIHISSLKLPEGVRPTIGDRDFTVATIAGALTKGGDDEAATPGAATTAAPAAAGDAKAAPAAAAGGKAPAAGGKAPAAGAKAPAAGGKAPPAAAKPAAGKK